MSALIKGGEWERLLWQLPSEGHQSLVTAFLSHIQQKYTTNNWPAMNSLSVVMVKIIATLNFWRLPRCEMLLYTKVLLTEQSLGVHHMHSPTGSNLSFHRKGRERGWPVECIQLAEHPRTQGTQGRTAHFTFPWTPPSLMPLISELTPEEGKGSRTLVLITDGRNIYPWIRELQVNILLQNRYAYLVIMNFRSIFSTKEGKKITYVIKTDKTQRYTKQMAFRLVLKKKKVEAWFCNCPMEDLFLAEFH